MIVGEALSLRDEPWLLNTIPRIVRKLNVEHKFFFFLAGQERLRVLNAWCGVPCYVGARKGEAEAGTGKTPGNLDLGPKRSLLNQRDCGWQTTRTGLEENARQESEPSFDSDFKLCNVFKIRWL